MEKQPPLWGVTANTTNTQSRTAEKGQSSSWGWVRCKQLLTVETGLVTKRVNSLGPRLNFWYNLSNGKETSVSGYGQVAGTCKRGNEPSGFIKWREFLDQQRAC